jgi:hypothetical protein
VDHSRETVCQNDVAWSVEWGKKVGVLWIWVSVSVDCVVGVGVGVGGIVDDEGDELG